MSASLLETLPEDLLTRIVTYLPPPENSSAILSLLHSTSSLEHLITSSRNSSFHINPLTEQPFNYLNQISVSTLQISHLSTVNLPPLPNLTTAHIHDIPAYFNHLCHSPIESLTVHYYGNCDVAQLFHFVKRLPLRELRIICMHRDDRAECPVTILRKQTDLLRNLCGLVQILELNCWRWEAGEMYPVIKDMNLKEITLVREVPDELIPYFRGIQSIKVESHGCRMVSVFGNSITVVNGLWVGALPLGKDDVRALKGCPRLRELRAVLEPGAEALFGDSVGEELKELSLAWTQYYSNCRSRVYAMERGSLSAIANAATNLRILTLPNVRICLPELISSMRVLQQLKVLELNVVIQDECVCEYIYGVLSTACMYNHDMRDVLLRDCGLDRGFRGLVHKKSIAVLLRFVERLHRVAPMLDTGIVKCAVVGLGDILCSSGGRKH